MSLALEDKYHLIRGQGENFASLLAKQVIEKPQPSAWIIILPVLFLYHLQLMQRYQRNLHSFARDLMEFKFMVLDGALEEARTGVFPRERITAGFNVPGAEAATPAVVHGKKLEELEILRPHYLLLLGGHGETYPELIRKSYETAGKYRFFLNQLFKAEKEVYAAVLQESQPTPEARQMVTLMEEVSVKLRESELKEIFG